MRRRERTGVPSDWPWYTRPDRWDVKVERRESPSGSFTVVTPKWCDPAFGPSVELRLRRRLELYLASGDDDGRHVVPLSAADARMVAAELDKVLRAMRSSRADVPDIRILPLPRAFTAEEARFFVRALRRLHQSRPELLEQRPRTVRSCHPRSVQSEKTQARDRRKESSR